MLKSVLKIILLSLTPSLIVLIGGYEADILQLVLGTAVVVLFLVGLSTAFTYIEWQCYRRTEKFKEYDFKDYIKEREIM